MSVYAVSDPVTAHAMSGQATPARAADEPDGHDRRDPLARRDGSRRRVDEAVDDDAAAAASANASPLGRVSDMTATTGSSSQ